MFRVRIGDRVKASSPDFTIILLKYLTNPENTLRT